MKKYLITVFAFFMLCGFATLSHAQSDAELELMQRAQMVAEIKKLRTENTAQKTVIDEQRGQIQTYDKLNTVQEARIADLKEALKFRTEARDVNQQVDAIRVQQINEYKDENTRLRDENASLRKSRDRRTWISGAAGMILGRFIF